MMTGVFETNSLTSMDRIEVRASSLTGSFALGQSKAAPPLQPPNLARPSAPQDVKQDQPADPLAGSRFFTPAGSTADSAQGEVKPGVSAFGLHALQAVTAFGTFASREQTSSAKPVRQPRRKKPWRRNASA